MKCSKNSPSATAEWAKFVNYFIIKITMCAMKCSTKNSPSAAAEREFYHYAWIAILPLSAIAA